jgi:hypothetical protein
MGYSKQELFLVKHGYVFANQSFFGFRKTQDLILEMVLLYRKFSSYPLEKDYRRSVK